MKKIKETGLDFEVDKLTNSIQNVTTGDSFMTDVTLVSTVSELKEITRKNKWQFDWKYEFQQPQKDIYKLTIVNNQNVIQGLVSIRN